MKVKTFEKNVSSGNPPERQLGDGSSPFYRDEAKMILRRVQRDNARFPFSQLAQFYFRRLFVERT